MFIELEDGGVIDISLIIVTWKSPYPDDGCDYHVILGKGDAYDFRCSKKDHDKIKVALLERAKQMSNAARNSCRSLPRSRGG